MTENIATNEFDSFINPLNADEIHEEINLNSEGEPP